MNQVRFNHILDARKKQLQGAADSDLELTDFIAYIRSQKLSVEQLQRCLVIGHPGISAAVLRSELPTPSSSSAPLSITNDMLHETLQSANMGSSSEFADYASQYIEAISESPILDRSQLSIDSEALDAVFSMPASSLAIPINSITESFKIALSGEQISRWLSIYETGIRNDDVRSFERADVLVGALITRKYDGLTVSADTFKALYVTGKDNAPAELLEELVPYLSDKDLSSILNTIMSDDVSSRQCDVLHAALIRFQSRNDDAAELFADICANYLAEQKEALYQEPMASRFFFPYRENENPYFGKKIAEQSHFLNAIVSNASEKGNSLLVKTFPYGMLSTGVVNLNDETGKPVSAYFESDDFRSFVLGNIDDITNKPDISSNSAWQGIHFYEHVLPGCIKKPLDSQTKNALFKSLHEYIFENFDNSNRQTSRFENAIIKLLETPANRDVEFHHRLIEQSLLSPFDHLNRETCRVMLKKDLLTYSDYQMLLEQVNNPLANSPFNMAVEYIATYHSINDAYNIIKRLDFDVFSPQPELLSEGTQGLFEIAANENIESVALELETSIKVPSLNTRNESYRAPELGL